MKLKHLLLTALMTVVGIGSSWAAGEITSGTSYYIQNVQSGLFLCGANSWGTQGSVSTQGELFKVELSDGTYTLTDQVVTASNKTFGYNLYVDCNTGENGNKWTIAPVEGEVGVFTIYGKGKANKVDNAFDGYLCQSDVAGGHIGFVAGSTKTVDNKAKWRLLTKEEAIAQLKTVTWGNSMSASFLLENPNFSRNHSIAKWTVSSNCTNKNLAGGDNGNMCAESYHSPFTISQKLEGVPNGVYGVTAQGFARSDGGNIADAMFFANEATQAIPEKTGTENSMTDASHSFSTGAYTIEEFKVTVTNGTLEVGIKNTSNGLWCIWDNFNITYYGVDVTALQETLNGRISYAQGITGKMNNNVAAALATAITDAQNAPATEEGLSEAITNINTAITKAEASVAVYTAIAAINGLVETLDAAGQAAYAETLAAYNAGTLETVAQAEERLRAAAKAQTTDGADMTLAIINPSFESDFTGWTYTDMAVQNNASFQHKDGNKYVESWQPNGTRSIKQKITDLPGGTYKLNLWAKARGVKSAKVFAGVNSTAVKIADEENDVTVDFVMDAGDVEIGFEGEGTGAGSSWFAIDNFRLTYVSSTIDFEELVPATGKMNAEIEAAQTAAINAFNENKTIANYNAAKAAIDNAKTSAKLYASNKVALDNQKALMDATNIYDAEGFAAYNTAYETALAAYNNGTATDEVVVNPNAATGWHASTAYNFLLTPWKLGESACNEFANALYINTWSDEGAKDGSNFTVPFFEYWVADGEKLSNNTLSTEVTDLENGLYSATAWVRVRATNGVAATDATGINLVAGDGTYAGSEGNGTVDATEGTQVGTSQFTLAEVTAYGLVKDGKLNIAFNVADANISWLSYKNVKYTKVRDLTPEEQIVYATPEQIAAFNAAITAAEAKTLGFLAGEYAPYKNIEAIKGIATAKAIDTTVPVDVEIINAAQAAIADDKWTANTEEVNAFYPLSNYNADSEKKDGRYTPLGWSNTTSHGDNYNTRIMVAPDGSNAGLTSNALFAKFETSYGEQEGYTMPLKAGVYSLSFRHGGWGEPGARTFNLTCGETTVVPFDTNKANSGYNDSQSNAEHWATYSGKFIIPEDGNYVFNLIKEIPNQQQIVISDLEIFSVPVTELAGTTVTTANQYGTFISEIDREIPEGMKVYTVEETEDDLLTLTPAESIKANTAYILENTSESNITIAAENGQSLKVAGSYTNGLLTGVYAETTAQTGWYVLQKHGDKVAFYQVGETEKPTVGANRCYLTVSSASEVFYFPGEGETTAIETVNALVEGGVEAIYNANGVKQQSLQKGINIVKLANGKTQKVLVK